MKALRFAVPLLAAILAACASWRWSGGPAADEAPKRGPAPVEVSAVPAKPRPAVPPTPKERYDTALFYSDMGPDTVDVSAYPAQQRYDYAVFARACSRCHTLARAVNAPLVGRGWWEFYMLGMRVRGRREGRPFGKEETESILNFLEYDSRVRKVERAHDFDVLTDELKGRFAESVSARLSSLQKSNPRPLTPEKP